MKTTKLNTKLIGKTITVVKLRDDYGREIEDGQQITGTYEGRISGMRPYWVSIDGLQINTRNWEVVA